MEIVTNPWVELFLENQLARGLQGKSAQEFINIWLNLYLIHVEY